MDAVEALAQRAQDRGARLAVAESLTCGLLASTIGKGESAQEWFAGGVICYALDVKERLLGLEPGTDPCSPECAEQLARGVRQLIVADVAVSVTGVGGPQPSDGHPAGTVYVGWADDTGTGHRMLELDTDDPGEVLEASVDAALHVFLDRLA
ncbi:CinA family protein [Microbacterium sp. ET2]|uniref:CinA family protein n=1 Tax=Microbacterium albipurpureum TaxID=3050384 RepID=UPI00259CF2B6|nr:CinA family protein [Microbacterium sp. ET2 (Ac-2212)]WJL96865.1 CinA family protein [Microbacterium sp. ET2 (Ac-2212)]